MASSVFLGGVFTTDSTGNATFTGAVVATKFSAVTGAQEFTAGPNGFFDWQGRAVLTSPLDGQMNVTNNATTIGAGMDVTTDAVVKVRTRAQNAYATVDALGYKVSGVAGLASFGPGAVSSLTVVNGLVTAAT